MLFSIITTFAQLLDVFCLVFEKLFEVIELFYFRSICGTKGYFLSATSGILEFKGIIVPVDEVHFGVSKRRTFIVYLSFFNHFRWCIFIIICPKGSAPPVCISAQSILSFMFSEQCCQACSFKCLKENVFKSVLLARNHWRKRGRGRWVIHLPARHNVVPKSALNSEGTTTCRCHHHLWLMFSTISSRYWHQEPRFSAFQYWICRGVAISGGVIIPRQAPNTTTTQSRQNPFEILIPLGEWIWIRNFYLLRASNLLQCLLVASVVSEQHAASDRRLKTPSTARWGRTGSGRGRGRGRKCNFHWVTNSERVNKNPEGWGTSKINEVFETERN